MKTIDDFANGPLQEPISSRHHYTARKDGKKAFTLYKTIRDAVREQDYETAVTLFEDATLGVQRTLKTRFCDLLGQQGMDVLEYVPEHLAKKVAKAITRHSVEQSEPLIADYSRYEFYSGDVMSFVPKLSNNQERRIRMGKEQMPRTFDIYPR